ncbi:MAG: diacylglycerol kinase family lipid kinase [Clostridia bacterium]|nr:diacylglycerol kinase family lipid kinase [Clostridia bacterium]
MYIIANPFAGRGRSVTVMAKIEEHLKAKNIEYELVWTEYPGQATELAREAAKTHKIVASAGGDGTMREVGMGLLGTGAALCVLPCGTGNDYYKGVGMPDKKKLEEVVDVMARGNTRLCDVGYANGSPFFNVLGCGLDMDIFEASIPLKKKFTGQFAYIMSIFKVLPAFKPHPIRISLDDGPLTDYKIMVCTINQTEVFGGGMKPAPGAVNDDGFFNICLLHNYYRRHIPLHLPKYIVGKHTKLKGCLLQKCQTVRIESDVPLPFEIDGDRGPVADRDQPVVVTIERQKIPVVVP